MAHSPEFNKRRRDAYREARRAGVPRRLAGHEYWEPTDPRFQRRLQEDLSKTLAATLPARRVHYPPSGAARQREVEAREGHRIYYTFHHQHSQYVKVRVDARDEDGTLRHRFLTVADDRTDPLTYGQVLDRISVIFTRHGGYHGSTIEGITYLSEEIYEDRSIRPLLQHRFNVQTGTYEDVV